MFNQTSKGLLETLYPSCIVSMSVVLFSVPDLILAEGHAQDQRVLRLSGPKSHEYPSYIDQKTALFYVKSDHLDLTKSCFAKCLIG